MTQVHQIQPTERQVIVEVRSVYGNEMIYPVCATALRFAKMVGKKTLSHADLADIDALGFTIYTKPAALNFRMG